MIDTMTNNPNQTSWQLAQASVDALTKEIESGRNEALFTYLRTMAKFPTYSARNVLLIAAQRPNSTHLEGMRSWNELGRSVRPGAKGNHDDPQALNIFLACTLPMAQRMAERKAERVFTHPTDWQLEAMYDGAVSNLINMFEVNRPLQPFVSNPFKRYLLITIVHGAMTAFRFRQEYWNIEGVEDLTKFQRIRGRYENPAERELITRDLLEQVTDQYTNRLSVVLQVIRRLSAIPNVQILISCREFDFNYDARFSSLDCQKVRLTEPTWEAVRQLLTTLGIETAKWPSDMRELMRNLQHLNVFVQNFANDSRGLVFETYQNMLEAMFSKRVIREYAPRTLEACERIAAKMSEDEELWLPRIALDHEYPQEVDRLIAAGILQESGRKIGFRHQTLFDYVRTRAFCSGADSLSGHVLPRQDALFVRSVLWSSLHALRSSSLERYCVEMGTLWESATLRRHLRLLLIAFLGQVSEPDEREAQWLLPTLDDPRLRGKTLGAIVGNIGWFRRLQSRLPALMTGSDEVTAWQVITILKAALAFEREAVFSLMSRFWSQSSTDELVLHAVYDLPDWDDRATGLVETILKRQAVKSHVVVHLAQQAAKANSGFGTRILAACLTNTLNIDTVSSTPPKEPQAQEQIASSGKLGRLLAGTDWYGVEEVASIEPAAFIVGIWPWFLQAATVLARPEDPIRMQYRSANAFEFDSIDNHILKAIRMGIDLYAQREPAPFLEFTRIQKTTELMIIHRMLAYGFEHLIAVFPNAVLEYLTADPRRMALGTYDDPHQQTKSLIAALSRALPALQLAPLESMVVNFEFFIDQPNYNAALRRERRRLNREHRLRLLRAFPAERLSATIKKLRDEEEIALPDTENSERRIIGGITRSRVSPQQMAKAANEDILNFLHEIAARSGDGLHGGVDSASQTFAAFAKDQPSRALAIIRALTPEAQEQTVGNALYTLAEASDMDPHEVVDLIKKLISRGSSSQSFRYWLALTLERLAVRCGGLDDEICEILKSWLAPVAADQSNQPDESKQVDSPESPSKHCSALLWSPIAGTVPGGNYTDLAAVSRGYNCRIPPAVDQWLETLEHHLCLSESLAVWRELIFRELYELQSAPNKPRAVGFLTRLITSYPKALTCFQGTLFLARNHRWLPAEFLQRAIKLLDASDWRWKEQAIGELAMLRTATVPTDEFVRSIVERAVLPSPSDSRPDLRRVGITFVCIRLWIEPEFRKIAHEILVPLAKAGDGYLPGAIMELFRIGQNIVPDEKTGELLRILVESPDLIRRGGPSFLGRRLKELLSDGLDCRLVAEVVRAILTATEPAIGESKTNWIPEPGELIQITITLQRIKATREIGLELFEALMDAGAYEADRVLREIDRRIL